MRIYSVSFVMNESPIIANLRQLGEALEAIAFAMRHGNNKWPDGWDITSGDNGSFVIDGKPAEWALKIKGLGD